MLYRKIIAVCSQIHTKHINTLCGKNVAFVNVKTGGTYSDRWALCWNVTRSVAQPQFLCNTFIPFPAFLRCAAIFWKTDFATRRVTYMHARPDKWQIQRSSMCQETVLRGSSTRLHIKYAFETEEDIMFFSSDLHVMRVHSVWPGL